MSKGAKFGHRVVRLEARAHQESDVRIILGNRPGGVLDTENLTQNQLVAGLGVFAHDALVVGIGDVFRRDIFDIATILGSGRGLMDARYPLLLEGDRIYRSDLQLLLGEKARR